ncbi:MAG: flagellar type III secretion system pore protein FliP [Gemmatimonadaceae bacterium]
MTSSAVVGVALTLALVLSLVAITMRLLRRVTSAAVTSRGAVTLSVLQRVALGPRQGIAIVQIGDQLLAVSVGEGGVHMIAELEALPAQAPVPAIDGSRAGFDFKTAFRNGLRNAGLPLGALLLTALIAPASVTAQTPRPADSLAVRAATIAALPVAPIAAPLVQAAVRKPAAAPAAGAQKPTPTGATAPVSSLDAVTRALPQIDLKLGESGGSGLRLNGTVGVVVMLGAMTMLPALLLLMTSFTRILIVLHFVKQALGTQTTPPAQLLAAMALLLTGFVMAPTLKEVNATALTPWMNGEIDQPAMMSAAIQPLRTFMIRQTRESDVSAFIEMSNSPPPDSIEATPTIVLMSAFVTGELRTSFQLGFALFLPFIIIDIVVSSVLMSMGMFMLPPAMIALPFKLLLFVLVDGWTLLMQSLVASFK